MATGSIYYEHQLLLAPSDALTFHDALLPAHYPQLSTGASSAGSATPRAGSVQSFEALLRQTQSYVDSDPSLSRPITDDSSLRHPGPSRALTRDITNLLHARPGDLAIHASLRPLLESDFARETRRRHRRYHRSRSEYRERGAAWRLHCQQLDRHAKQRQAALPAASSAYDSAPAGGALQRDNRSAASPVASSSRSISRRNTAMGDAVHSEAAFQAILAQLETADMQNPTLRATRTAAIVPDLLDAGDAERVLAVVDESGIVLNDPLLFYASEMAQQSQQWTEEEIYIFCRRFAQSPKAFGKIAAGLPGRSTADCVSFYYEVKAVIDFRRLTDKRARRKTRALKKGSSLLANLARPSAGGPPIAEEGDDDGERSHDSTGFMAEGIDDIPLRARAVDCAAVGALARIVERKRIASTTNAASLAAAKTLTGGLGAEPAILHSTHASDGPYPLHSEHVGVHDVAMSRTLLPAVELRGPLPGFFGPSSTQLQQTSPIRRPPRMALGSLLNEADDEAPANWFGDTGGST